MKPLDHETRRGTATECARLDHEHRVRAEIARIRVILTDIRTWTQGIVSSLDEGDIRSADLDTLDRELRAIESRLEAITSLVVMDR